MHRVFTPFSLSSVRPVVAVFAMYSFWLPQVVYSAYMGTKHSFHPLYLVGVSLCHLFIPLYILGCPNNFLGLLSVYTNPHYLAEIAGEHGAHAQDLHHLSLSSVSACWVLVVWMTFQVGMLLLQTALGPRFFVPKKWLPSRYDYKRPVPDTLRAAFPASNGSGSGHSTPRGSGSGRNESLGDIAMTGIRSRSSASSSSSTRASSTSGYGGLQALFGYGRSSSGAAGSDNEEDMETGRLLGDGGGSSGGGVAGSGSNASPSATSGESNPGGMDCAICCNLIHFNSRDNLVSFYHASSPRPECSDVFSSSSQDNAMRPRVSRGVPGAVDAREAGVPCVSQRPALARRRLTSGAFLSSASTCAYSTLLRDAVLEGSDVRSFLVIHFFML